MVQQETLNRVFASLADPTRRDILIRLGTGPATISELTAPTGMSLTGMKKHVQALESAGLVVTRKVGRSRQCRLADAPLDGAMAWLAFYQRLWARRLDGLDAYLTLRPDQPARPAGPTRADSSARTDPTSPTRPEGP